MWEESLATFSACSSRTALQVVLDQLKGHWRRAIVDSNNEARGSRLEAIKAKFHFLQSQFKTVEGISATSYFTILIGVISIMEDQKRISMSDQRTLFLVNIFIIHTVRFLNKFSAICEQKLADVHRRMLRLDATLSLLEEKLKSIDGLEAIGESFALDMLTGLAIPRRQEHAVNIDTSRETSATLSISTSAIEQPLDSVVSSHEEEHQLLPMIKDDPQFARFFRMLRVGVPEQGVKLQMSIEGYNPSLLDKPDAPLPPK